MLKSAFAPSMALETLSMLKKGEMNLQKQLHTNFKKHSSGLEVRMRSYFGLNCQVREVLLGIKMLTF